MQSAVARIEASNAEMAARVDRIVAEVEDSPRRHGDTEEIGNFRFSISDFRFRI